MQARMQFKVYSYRLGFYTEADLPLNNEDLIWVNGATISLPCLRMYVLWFLAVGFRPGLSTIFTILVICISIVPKFLTALIFMIFDFLPIQQMMCMDNKQNEVFICLMP